MRRDETNRKRKGGTKERVFLKKHKRVREHDQAYAKTAAATAATARPELSMAAVSARKLTAPFDLLLDDDELWLEELAELDELAGAELELEPDEPEEEEPEEPEPEPEEEPVVAVEPLAAAEPELLRHEVSVPARTVASLE